MGWEDWVDLLGLAAAGEVSCTKIVGEEGGVGLYTAQSERGNRQTDRHRWLAL